MSNIYYNQFSHSFREQNINNSKILLIFDGVNHFIDQKGKKISLALWLPKKYTKFNV